MKQCKALLPVSQFLVRYETKIGRPFSPLEQFVLRAVARGRANTLSELEHVLRVHRRLIIEGLVTLMQEGWLALGEQDEFVVTADGEFRAAANGPLKTDVVSRQDTTYVTLERFGGTLYPDKAAWWTWVDQLQSSGWSDGAIELPERFTVNQLEESEVADLIQLRTDRDQREWLNRVLEVRLDSRFKHVIPLKIDLSRGLVLGLPPRGNGALVAAILEYVFERPALAENATEADGVDLPVEQRAVPRDWRRHLRAISFSRNDFILTEGEHASYVLRALSEAHSKVFIASAFLRTEVIDQLLPAMRATVARGVSVDVLWGYGAEVEALNAIQEAARDARRSGGDSSLFVNRSPSDSHMKIIIWDTEDGEFEACIGSHNWLSSPLNPAAESIRNVTVRLNDPMIAARLAQRAAGLWSQVADEDRHIVTDRWRAVFSSLNARANSLEQSQTDAQSGVVDEEDSDQHDGTDEESQESQPEVQWDGMPSTDVVRALVVLDREHDELVQEWCATSRSRLMVISHQLGRPALRRLASLHGRDGTAPCVISFGRLSDGVPKTHLDAVGHVVTSGRGIFSHVPGLHAKVLISDASVCVSSFNFLSADPYGRSSGAKEVGLVIENEEIAGWLWNKLLSTLPIPRQEDHTINHPASIEQERQNLLPEQVTAEDPGRSGRSNA